MYRTTRWLAALTACAFLGACADSAYLHHPRATLFPASEQQTMASASHWNLVARNESAQIRESLGDGGGIITPSVYLGTATPGAGDFQTAYHNMLLSALVDEGVAVMLQPENALFTVDYEVQVVEHDSRSWLPPRPGTITAFLLTGVGIHDSQYWGDRGLVLLPVAMAGDLWSRFNKDTHTSVTELIVTTRVQDSQQIVHSSNRVYYFDEADIAQYRGKGRVFQVVDARGNE
ncbi:MAG: hypothetical protein KDI28_08975 [Pseudomonadales bacterium]|nr:hypothetical protein [Pseudomonadales bacterium]MCP5358951.1 hypothetical protein [Pseudomonadales bacterium]